MIVHVAPGSYTCSVTLSLSGTASGRVQFISDVTWGAVLDGGGADNAWNIAGDYEDVIGFEIKNAARQGVNATGSHTRVLGAKIHDIALNTPCDGTGADAWGQDTYTSSDAEISNSIYNIGPGSTAGSRCNTIQGIYFADPIGKATNNIITKVTGDCTTTWHYATQVIIENNTVEACSDAGLLLGADATTTDNSVIANNMVINSNVGIAENGNVGSNMKYVDNLFFGNSAGNCKCISAGCSSASGTINSSPQLVNDTGSVATGDYHLQSGSPQSITEVTYIVPLRTSMVTRPYGSSCDFGAYEWHP